MKFCSILLICVLGSLGRGAYAQNIDHVHSHDLYIFMHESCKITQYYMPLLDTLHTEYGDKIRFVGVFPNKSSSVPAIDSFQKEFGIDFELIKDQGQMITKKYGAMVTPEIVVVENSSGNIIYQGRIDDAYFRVGKRRTVKQTQELVDILQAIAEGVDVYIASQPAIGCFIQM